MEHFHGSLWYIYFNGSQEHMWNVSLVLSRFAYYIFCTIEGTNKEQTVQLQQLAMHFVKNGIIFLPYLTLFHCKWRLATYANGKAENNTSIGLK